MSVVYLGYDQSALSPVAVKLLADHLADRKPFVSRFHREARTTTSLQHPNLVRGLAAGYDSVARKHYLAMEYVDGPTAHAVLARASRLPVPVVVRIGIDVTAALEYLHSLKYVHRDVKPDNVIVAPDGSAKLADLGLAKRWTEDAELTHADQSLGTPHYMPIEQAANAAMVDGRSDLFALGATLYHLITGQVPFPGGSHEQITRDKAHGTFRPARELVPGLPPAVDRILIRSLARDIRERYQTAADFARDLRATGLSARVPSELSASAPAVPDAAPTQPVLPAVPLGIGIRGE